jgi:metal-responsive CopG/Arc/MetJ family transcriptional regulator
VKTAISLPDALFDQATARAAELGISRSAFFARAVELYLDELSRHTIAEQINEALASAGADESGAVAAAAGERVLAAGEDW